MCELLPLYLSGPPCIEKKFVSHLNVTTDIEGGTSCSVFAGSVGVIPFFKPEEDLNFKFLKESDI